MACDVREHVAACAAARERGGDRHGPVDEVLLGREQRELDPVPGEMAQGQERLQASDAAVRLRIASQASCGELRAAQAAVVSAVTAAAFRMPAP